MSKSTSPSQHPTKTASENQHIREELTPSATRLPTATSTPTPTPFPDYSPQKVIFEYTIEGSHSPTEVFFDTWGRTDLRMVIYENGQMILAGDTVQQKVLTSEEITQFVDRLTELGFFALESNQEHDLTDKLYNFGDAFELGYDGLESCIRVNAAESRKLCVSFFGLPYVVPEMSEILSFVDAFHPAGMTGYTPDRLFVNVLSGRYDSGNETPYPAVAWPDFIPITAAGGEIFYLEGENASQVYKFFTSHSSRVILQLDGREYTAYYDIIFPHEMISNQKH